MPKAIPKLFMLLSLMTLVMMYNLLFTNFAHAEEMPVANDATCWSCHPTFVTVTTGATTTTAVYGGMHPTTTIGCTRCHYTTISRNTKINYCTNCHFNNAASGGALLLTLQHLGDSSFQNLANVRHPITSKHQSSMTECGTCHSLLLTEEHYQAGRTDTSGNPINCNTCHTGAFLGEELSTAGVLKIQKPTITAAMWYPPEGRTISKIYIDATTISPNGIEIYALQSDGKWGFVYGRANGKVVKEWFELPTPAKGIYTKMYATSFNYNIASGLDVPKVLLTPSNARVESLKSAIAENDTRCATCHEETNHIQLHNSGMDANCLGCHNLNLTVEHIENSTTDGKGYTCNTCHGNSAQADVKRTIADENLNCAGCHSSGHNTNFTLGIPSDIPLYEGFDWTVPLDADLFTGDPGASQSYLNSGKVVMSNRRLNLDISAVWNFYQTQLIVNGWDLNSTPPAPEANYFAVEFVKANRALTIKVFNTEAADGVGNALAAGSRLELWYK